MHSATVLISIENIVQELIACLRDAQLGPVTLEQILAKLKIIYTTELDYSYFTAALHKISGHAKVARGVLRLIDAIEKIDRQNWNMASSDDALRSIYDFVQSRDLSIEQNNRIMREILQVVFANSQRTTLDFSDEQLSTILQHDNTNSLRAELRVSLGKAWCLIETRGDNFEFLPEQPALEQQVVNKAESTLQTALQKNNIMSFSGKLWLYGHVAAQDDNEEKKHSVYRPLSLEEKIALNIY